MRCPKCRSEVGNQAVCPYCGGTVYVQESSWDAQMKILQEHPGATQQLQSNIRELEEQIHSLQTKMNLMLVFQGSVMALIILLLVVLGMQ